MKKEKWEKGLMVKGRNEPATITHVAHVVAQVKEISIEEVCEQYVPPGLLATHYCTSGLPLTFLLGRGVIRWKCLVLARRWGNGHTTYSK